MIHNLEELRLLRRDGLAPAAGVLLTDSPTIEWSWAEILKEHEARWNEPTPCSVLFIERQSPCDLTPLRGLHVFLMLVHRDPEPWRIRLKWAKPASVIDICGTQAIECAADMADAFYNKLQEEL